MSRKYREFLRILGAGVFAGAIAQLIFINLLAELFPPVPAYSTFFTSWMAKVLLFLAGPTLGFCVLAAVVYFITKFHNEQWTSRMVRSLWAGLGGMLFGAVALFTAFILLSLPIENALYIDSSFTISQLHHYTIWIVLGIFLQFLVTLSYRQTWLWGWRILALLPVGMGLFYPDIAIRTIAGLVVQSYLVWMLIGAGLGWVTYWYTKPYMLWRTAIKGGIVSGFSIALVFQIKNLAVPYTLWGSLDMLFAVMIFTIGLLMAHCYFSPLKHRGRVVLNFFTAINNRQEIRKRVEYTPSDFFLQSYYESNDEKNGLYIGGFSGVFSANHCICLDDDFCYERLFVLNQSLSLGLYARFAKKIVDEFNVTRIRSGKEKKKIPIKVLENKFEADVPSLRYGDKIRIQPKPESSMSDWHNMFIDFIILDVS